LVQAANQLTALDKATGKWLWSYDAGSAAAEATSQAHFTALSDVLLVRRDAGQVSTTALDQDGVVRWTIATQVTEVETGDLYLLDGNVLSRLDRYTGAPVWSYASTLPASGIFELLGGHGNAVFFAGPSDGGWSPPPVRTVTALNRSDGHLLWQSAEQVAGSLMAADEERLYLWSGATAKYDTYGVTTAIWFGSR
jgi:outer membrane protein assembly factor BamB